MTKGHSTTASKKTASIAVPKPSTSTPASTRSAAASHPTVAHTQPQYHYIEHRNVTSPWAAAAELAKPAAMAAGYYQVRSDVERVLAGLGNGLTHIGSGAQQEFALFKDEVGRLTHIGSGVPGLVGGGAITLVSIGAAVYFVYEASRVMNFF